MDLSILKFAQLAKYHLDNLKETKVKGIDSGTWKAQNQIWDNPVEKMLVIRKIVNRSQYEK